MNKSYKLQDVEVRLVSGVVLRATIESLDGARAFLEDVKKAKLGEPEVIQERPQTTKDHDVDEHARLNPVDLMESKAGLKKGALKPLVAVKDETPQILSPRVFKKTTDGVLALIFAAETGLRKGVIEYDHFSRIFEQQNLKCGSPLSMLLKNLRQTGYLDRKTYADGRRIRLTGKGETKAIEVLTSATTQGTLH